MKSQKPAHHGRSTRWEEHRKEKRSQLATDAVRAIRQYGAGVSMEDIAAVAGTSKPVYYRHFDDRAGLWAAVVDRTVNYIYRHLSLEDTRETKPYQLIVNLTETYLTLVDKDPEIYKFVTTTPDSAMAADNTDPAVTLTSRIGERVAENFKHHNMGEDASVAAHAIVGSIWAVTDKWVATGRTRPKEDIVKTIASLFSTYLNNPSPTPVISTQGGTS